MKQVAYVFHSNGNSFDMMIFITIIQPKMGFLKQRICFHHFYFHLLFTSKHFSSGHIILRSSCTFFSFNRFQKQLLISFQKQPHIQQKNIDMFLEAATQSSTYSKTMCCTFSFRSSYSLISFRSSRPVLKKHWNTPRSSHRFLNKQEIYSEAAAQIFHGFCTKYTHFVWIFFITLRWLWKASLMDGLKI